MAPTNYTTSPEELDHFFIQVNPVPLAPPDLSALYAVVDNVISLKEHAYMYVVNKEVMYTLLHIDSQLLV